MDVVAVALCAFGVLRPPSPGTPVLLDAIGAVAGLLFSAVLWAQGARPPRALVATNLVAYVALTGGIVADAGTGEGAASASMSFLFVALYVAAFFPRGLLRPSTTAIVVVAGAALTVSEPVGNPLTTWLPLTLALVVATELLAALLEQLRVLSLTDSLTGVLNRTGFEDLARREQAAAARTGEPLAVVVVDLDDFKAVNDRDGHAAGDALLAELTGQWRTELRARDAIGRRGGDEFALLLPSTSEQEARALVARLRAASPTPWSWGVTSVDPDDDLEERLAGADREMYRQKQAPPGPLTAA